MLSTRNGSHSSQVVKVTRADNRFKKKKKVFQLSCSDGKSSSSLRYVHSPRCPRLVVCSSRTGVQQSKHAWNSCLQHLPEGGVNLPRRRVTDTRKINDRNVTCGEKEKHGQSRRGDTEDGMRTLTLTFFHSAK